MTMVGVNYIPASEKKEGPSTLVHGLLRVEDNEEGKSYIPTIDCLSICLGCVYKREAKCTGLRTDVVYSEAYVRRYGINLTATLNGLLPKGELVPCRQPQSVQITTI